MIESASIKKSCFNGNPEKIVFGLNIRTISRSKVAEKMAASSYTCVLSSRRSFLSILRSYSRYSTAAFIDKNQLIKTSGRL